MNGRAALALLVFALIAKDSRAQDNLSVFLVDPDVGYVGGGTGFNSESPGTTILKTADAGLTWSPQTSGAHNSIHSLYFINPDTGWAVGWNPIFKTVDGGSHWIPVAPGTGEFYYSVFFLNADTGWVVGNNTLMKTGDGGGSWNAQPIADCCDSGYTLNSIRFTGADTGYAVGSSYIGIDWGYYRPPAGLILKTTDAGATWHSQINGIANTLNSVSFGNADTGWAVGDSGLILHTDNGGKDWVGQSGGTFNNLRSVCFQGTRIGWAVGDSGTILKTGDGGAHWISHPGITGNNLRSVFLLNPNTGMIAGDSNTLLTIHQGALPIAAPAGFTGSRFSLEHGVIRYSLPRLARIKAVLYGTDGKMKRRIFDGVQGPGEHTLDLSALNAPSGIYLLEFTGGHILRRTRIVFIP